MVVVLASLARSKKLSVFHFLMVDFRSGRVPISVLTLRLGKWINAGFFNYNGLEISLFGLSKFIGKRQPMMVGKGEVGN